MRGVQGIIFARHEETERDRERLWVFPSVRGHVKFIPHSVKETYYLFGMS